MSMLIELAWTRKGQNLRIPFSQGFADGPPERPSSTREVGRRAGRGGLTMDWERFRGPDPGSYGPASNLRPVQANQCRASELVPRIRIPPALGSAGVGTKAGREGGTTAQGAMAGARGRQAFVGRRRRPGSRGSTASTFVGGQGPTGGRAGGARRGDGRGRTRRRPPLQGAAETGEQRPEKRRSGRTRGPGRGRWRVSGRQSRRGAASQKGTGWRWRPPGRGGGPAVAERGKTSGSRHPGSAFSTSRKRCRPVGTPCRGRPTETTTGHRQGSGRRRQGGTTIHGPEGTSNERG